MPEYYRSASLMDGELADYTSDVEMAATERGDHVIVFSFGHEDGFNVTLHLRRGMTRQNVAEGLRKTAETILEG